MSAVNVLGDILLSIRNGKLSEDELQLVIEAVRVTRQVTSLCDEVERLRAEVAELDELREKMAGILSRTAVALRGPEPSLTRWSWHDLPERAAAAIAAIDVMQRAA